MVSPTARKMEAEKLYSIIIGIPIKYIFIYFVERSMTLSGQFIQPRNVLEKKKPTKSKTAPSSTLTSMDIPTTFLADSLSPLPA